MGLNGKIHSLCPLGSYGETEPEGKDDTSWDREHYKQAVYGGGLPLLGGKVGVFPVLIYLSVF